MTQSIWQYRGEPTSKPEKALIDAADGSPLVAKILSDRGYDSPELIKAFLNLDDYTPTSGLELPDMQKGLDRVIKAIDDEEPILIFGDFDVDGQTGTSIFYETLTTLGAKVSYYIPDRATEGHGLNNASLIRLKSSLNFKVVITTDTGITNFTEVSLLNGLGVDTIITDHHELPDNLPPALANINPMRFDSDSHPLYPLCGAGVAYKFCELLNEHYSQTQNTPKLLDLTALGTVADLAQLKAENRYLVHQGLKIIATRQRTGLAEILELAGTPDDANITAETCGFVIGPRLNALGRLELAKDSVELLTTTDKGKAHDIAVRLESLNQRRKTMCDETFLEAEKHLQRTGLEHRVIILGSPDWHLGIIGIVASRLIEKYHVPVLLMKIDEEKQVARCSARSIPGFSIHEHFSKFADMFEGFGGHAGAGGFTLPLDKLNTFKEKFFQIADSVVTEEMMRPVVDVDAKLDWSQLNPHLIEMIDKMAPYGMGNPSLKFVVENTIVSAQRGIGDNNRHMKLVLSQKSERNKIDGLIWNYGDGERFDQTEPYAFVVVPQLNTFNGNTKVQLIIDDFKTSNVNAKPKVAAEKVSLDKTTTIKTVTPSKPKTTATNDLNKTDNGTAWIDHRSRDSVESFMGQLMKPNDETKSLIYHEGRTPDIPFLDDSLLASRQQVKASEQLIFWDLPPTLEAFKSIVASTEADTIHLVGGKYQSVPVFQPEQQFLKLMVQWLHQQTAKQQQETLNFTVEELSTRLATSEAVINSGLILLHRLTLAEVFMTDAESQTKTLSIRINPNPPNTTNITNLLEFDNFKASLNAVGRFRNWLLSEDVDTIKHVAFQAENFTFEQENTLIR